MASATITVKAHKCSNTCLGATAPQVNEPVTIDPHLIYQRTDTMKDLNYLRTLYAGYNAAPSPVNEATFGHRIMDWFFPAVGLEAQTGWRDFSAAGIRLLKYFTKSHRDNIYYFVFDGLNGYQARSNARNGDILVLKLYEVSYFQYGTTQQGVTGPPTSAALYFSLKMYHKGTNPSSAASFAGITGVMDLGYHPTRWIPAQCHSPAGVHPMIWHEAGGHTLARLDLGRHACRMFGAG